MQSLAYKAYEAVQTRTASDRDIEYALFEQITRALQDVSANADASPAMRVDAISRNLQLWTVLAADLMADGNGLDAPLKRGLVGLAEYTRRRSMILLAEAGNLSDLIDINTTVMQGLQPSRSSAGGA